MAAELDDQYFRQYSIEQKKWDAHRHVNREAASANEIGCLSRGHVMRFGDPVDEAGLYRLADRGGASSR